MLLHVYKDPRLRSNRIVVFRGSDLHPFPRAVSFGNETITVQTRQPVGLPFPNLYSQHQPATSLSVGMSQQVMKRLRLPEQSRLLARIEGNKLRIGPCLGIYVRTFSSHQHPFGEQSRLLKELSGMAAERGIDLVVMGPGFLQSYRGWRYDATAASWREQQLPLPDVIYRRSGAFAASDASLVQADLRGFADLGRLHTLPRTFSNKWRLYKVLSEQDELKPYLLHTELISDEAVLLNRLRQLQDAYAKPLTGTQGNLVFRLQAVSDGIRVRWEKPSKNLEPREVMDRFFPNQRGFMRFWETVGPRRCILQETFPLPHTNNGNPFDLRWLVQYVDGQPKVVARVARVGHHNSVTTNVHTGGRPVDAVELLDGLNWRAGMSSIQQVDEVAVAVTEACKDTYGPIVELGVDLAVAGNGEIRIFEVNSTPGRRMLRLISSDLREMSLRYLLEYAINATGFAGES